MSDTPPPSDPTPSTSTSSDSTLLPLSPEERRSQRRNRIRQWASYLGLSGSSVGIVAAIALLQQGQWLEAIGVILVTMALTGLVIMGQFARKLTDRILDKLEERLEERIEPLATWIVDGLEQAAIGLWWRLLSPFEQRYTQSLMYEYRDFKTQGLRTRGPFVLDLEKVFVPLRVAPDSLDRIPSALIRDADARSNLQIWDVLAVQQPTFRRLVIIGAPGSGKSTLLEHLTLTYAQRRQRRYHPKAPKLLPVLLTLRELREAIAQQPALNLATLWEQQPTVQDLKPPPRWLQTQLQRGRCLVMLDGLDEVADPEQRQVVSRWVDHQIQAYPTVRFIVTSRPHGYRTAPLSKAGALLEVKPFTIIQVQQFIQNWYLQNELMSRLGKDDPGVRLMADRKAADLIDRIRRNPPLAAMATNPLLLTMIATVHCFRGALPGRRVELYAEICDVLLGRRQDAKGMDGSLTAGQKKSVLQVLALNRMRHRSEECSIVTGGLVIQQQLDAVAGNALYPEEFLQYIETGSGLLVEERAGIYKFAHRSFLEYLAAVQIKELKQDMLLTRNIDDPWWEETIRLYAAQQDASDIVWAALQRQTVESLSLAYDCMRESLSMSDRSVRQELATTLEQGLESTDGDLFRLAVEVQLSRRLKALLRVDDRTDLDGTLIAQADYQLFIDEMRQAGNNHHPDHWQGDRFLPETSQDPIQGIRAQDAEAFCAWLTYRCGNLGDLYLEGDSSVFVGDSRIRIPTVEEAQAYPVSSSRGIYWCQGDRGLVLHGMSDDQRTAWLMQLHRAGDRDADGIRTLAQTLTIPTLPPRPASRHAPHPQTRDREVALSRARDRAFQRLLTQALPLEQDMAQAFALNASPSLHHGHLAGWMQDINHIRDRQQALLVPLPQAQTLARRIIRDRSPIPSSDLAWLRAYTPLVALWWYDLADIYERLSRSPRLLRLNQRSRQQCQSLAQTYRDGVESTFNLYAFWVVLDERRAQTMPVWEGLRLVREQRVPD